MDFFERCYSPYNAVRQWLTIRLCVVDAYDSILLVQKTLAQDEEPFITRTRAALDLIMQFDPAAWHMVRREIRYIIDDYIVSGGEYRRRDRACAVDFEGHYVPHNPTTSPEGYREWYVASLASTIVHEATHGRLASLGVPYVEHTRVRVERICAKRQRRFLARLHSDSYDLMAIQPPFDAARWEPYWNPASRSAKVREMKRRMLRDLLDLIFRKLGIRR